MSLERADRPWAVRRPIVSRKDATTVYNGLVYQKAAAVLDTVESWLGEDPFQRGLQKYLTDHAYGIATTDDVASALQAATGVEVAPVLHSLLDRPGVPVVTATLDCKRLTVDAGGWTLPLCSHWDNGGRQCVVVRPGTKEISIDAASCPAWIWTNASGRGYYRSRLSAADLQAIQSDGYPQLDASERRALIADAGSAVLTGQLPTAALMKLLTTSARDQEPRVSLESLRIATSLAEVVPLPQRAAYARWLQQTFGVTPPGPKQSLSLADFLKGWEAPKPKPAQ
jgi:alanyl aminopeptidase